MSLKKKIILSFFISAFLIALLAAFEYVNFVEIRKEIRFLELTDTIRSKSLQLRRHEKNFFLYGPSKADEEAKEIRRYLDELMGLMNENFPKGKENALPALREQVGEYGRKFSGIESALSDRIRTFKELKTPREQYVAFFPLVESTFYERPLQAADLLETVFLLPAHHRLAAGLRRLDAEINGLRKTGEDIITAAKELDKDARDNVESGIRVSQAAIIIIFPLFLVSGLAMLFIITRNVVNRLGLLIGVVEKTGQGSFGHVPVPAGKWGRDEVGVLIEKFDHMEDQLAERAEELEHKNRELLQSKKLAAIGTLAAGVAHELNNPLNNIYLSTQVLVREAGAACPAGMNEVVGDILGQTVRVKRIVGDLLEFARGRDPQVREVELKGLIRGVFNRLRATTEQVAFSLEADAEQVLIQADPDQLEQVFVNLFTNAVEAMAGRGELNVRVMDSVTHVRVRVTDTGNGVPGDSLEKIFEPFFTMKDKGTGLGLAIVFNIIKKHGGEITAESEEGKGTTFTITLPREHESMSR